MVTDAEIARRLGTSREQVGHLASRSDFPAPVGLIDSGTPQARSVPFWRWSDVDHWACHSGHTPLARR